MINNPTYVDDLSLAEIKKILTEKGKDKELNYEQKMALEHAKQFAKLTPLKADNRFSSSPAQLSWCTPTSLRYLR